jgi:hypothetical protein
MRQQATYGLTFEGGGNAILLSYDICFRYSCGIPNQNISISVKLQYINELANSRYK